MDSQESLRELWKRATLKEKITCIIIWISIFGLLLGCISLADSCSGRSTTSHKCEYCSKTGKYPMVNQDGREAYFCKEHYDKWKLEKEYYGY